MCLKSFYTLVTSVNTKKNFLFNTTKLPNYSYILKARSLIRNLNRKQLYILNSWESYIF